MTASDTSVPMRPKTIFLVTLSTVLVASVFFVDPIPQDPLYHAFVDTRSIIGVPNFWNVASNIPFLLAGGAGLYYLSKGKIPDLPQDLTLSYVIFFTGIFLTGFGSAYYHYAPSNATLVWDRLPMTLGFMGLFTIVIGEHISVPTAKRLLVPLLIVGVGSVAYWAVTEARGAGDLRPYAIVQFLPMLLIPLILIMYESVFDSVRAYWLVIALYVLSKLFEHFDELVYEAGGLISGHSLKHVAAAIAPLVLLIGFTRRRLKKL